MILGTAHSSFLVRNLQSSPLGESVIDLWERLEVVFGQGLTLESNSAMRRRALVAANSTNACSDNIAVRRHAPEGRGNAGLWTVSHGGVTLFHKASVNPREFRVAEALMLAPEIDCLPRVHLCVARGPIFHIFLENIPEFPTGRDPIHFADLACAVSTFATAKLSNVAPSRMHWFKALQDSRFLREFAAHTGHSADALNERLNRVTTQPRAIVHNDLQSGNIRQRPGGTPVAIDLGGIGWSLLGSEFYRLVPSTSAPPAGDDTREFEDAVARAADNLAVPAEQLAAAAIAYAAARAYRSGRKRRDRKRQLQAYEFAARLLQITHLTPR